MTIVTSARDGAVATITLDRPQEGNLLSVEGVRELAAAFRAATARISAAAATTRAAGPRRPP
jgi:enoyl-CoA hydratase/carnithine racemase